MQTPNHIRELFQDVRLCNCAECGCELLGREQFDHAAESAKSLIGVIPIVAGRIKDRPYCDRCLDTEGSGNAGIIPECRTQEYHDRVYHGA